MKKILALLALLTAFPAATTRPPTTGTTETAAQAHGTNTHAPQRQTPRAQDPAAITDPDEIVGLIESHLLGCQEHRRTPWFKHGAWPQRTLPGQLHVQDREGTSKQAEVGGGPGAGGQVLTRHLHEIASAGSSGGIAAERSAL